MCALGSTSYERNTTTEKLIFNISHIRTENVADIFTKSLPKRKKNVFVNCKSYCGDWCI